MEARTSQPLTMERGWSWKLAPGKRGLWYLEAPPPYPCRSGHESSGCCNPRRRPPPERERGLIVYDLGGPHFNG
jgi:hypothetical protein